MNENELQENLDAILADKQANLLPQNLKAGVTLLGVTGTIVDGGIDTTDADAVAGDLAYGKTAYVNGEKITGTNEYSDIPRYNVEINSNIPASRDVIWAKYTGNYEGVEFLFNQEMAGNALPNANLTFLNTNTNEIGQEIYNSCMYVFGTTQEQSYKFDLKTKSRVNITVPNVSVRSGFGTCLYNDKIFVFWENGNLYYYIYDPNTDTSSDVVNTNFYASYYSDRGETGNVTVYNGVAYMQTCYSASSSGGSSIIRFNLETRSVDKVSGGVQRPGRCSTGYGRYKYIMSDGRNLYRFDCINSSTTQFKAFTSSQLDSYCLPYCVDDDIILLFPTGTKNYYYKYIISEDSLTRISIDYTYYIFDTFGTWSKIPTSFDWFKLDKLTGILYIRTQSSYGGGYYGATGAIQLFVPIDYSQYSDGTLFATVSPDATFIKIQEDNNLYTGIDNFYRLDNGSLTNQFMVCYGDGEEFKVLQNPTHETYTVTFDTAGGSAISPRQVICGEPVPVSSITPPTKYHYLFNEWYYNNKPLDIHKPFVLDITLTATWNDAVIVTFDYGNGISTTQTILVGAKATKPTPDPVKDWNEFLGWSLNGVPFDFNTAIYNDITLTPIWGTVTEVDYIYSTGTQYIDTEIIPNQNTKVETKFKFLADEQPNRYSGLFGCQNESGNQNGSFTFTNTTLGWDPSSSMGFKSGNGDYMNLGAGVQYEKNKEYIAICKHNEMMINEDIYTASNTWTDLRCSMFIFNRNIYNSSIDTILASAVMYYFKVYNGDSLIMHLKPAKTYDNQYCLYDIISKKVFKNLGRGIFYGPGKSYTPVEYLQSNGDAYINTELKNRADVRFVTEMSASGADVVCGGEYSSSYSFRWGLNSSGVVYFGYNGSNRTTSVYGSIADYYKYDMKSGAQAIYNAGGTQLISYTSTMSTYSNSPIYLFRCANNNGTNWGNNTMRIKSFKSYMGNVLVMDLIPAIDENNTPCMYDMLYQGYYYSQTSSQFIIPQTPTYTQISYLQTTGTQWFDTGITNSSSVKLMMEYNLNKYWKNDGIIFGGRDSTSSNAFMLFSKYLDPKSYFWYYRSTNITGTTTNDYFGKDVTLSATNGVVTLADGINTENISITGQSTFTGSTKLTIFNGQTSSSSSIMEDNCMTGKIYHIQVWVNNALQRDYIPVKDENDVVCFYDRIWNTYLYHNGRGELLDHSLDGFENADYIDTYGTQYIKTGVKPTQNTKVEIKAKLLKDNYFDGALFGCQNSSTTNNRMGLWFNGLSRQIVLAPFMGSQSLRYVNEFNADTDYTFILDSSGLNVNGEQIASWTVPNFTCTDELTLFAISGKSADEWKRFIGRVYYCKIWENDVLIRNFTPKVDCSGNTIMYDNVNGNYYAPFGGGMCTSGLPEGYTQIPYIRNVTQDTFINTGFKPNNNTRVIAVQEVMSWRAWGSAWGVHGDPKRFFIENNNNNSTISCAYGSTSSSMSMPWKGTHIIDFDRNSCRINQTTVTMNAVTFQADTEIVIFNRSNSVNMTYPTWTYSDFKIFAFTIYDNGTLVRQLIPCYRNSDNRTGMYDVVNNRFYYSYTYDDNGHEFYYGSNIYNELQYLEGGVGQYIDTGYKPNQNTDTYLQLFGTDNTGYWFGAWDTAYNNGAYAVCNDTTGIYSAYGNQGGTNGSVLSNAAHTITFQRGALWIDGSSFKTFSTNNFQLNHSVYLFAQNRAGTPFIHLDKATSIKMQDVIFTNGESIVEKHFIPVIRKSDNVVGMYEVINDVFYTNAGIREFGYQEIGTSSAQQSGYTEVSYIRSSGTQYIDTGLKGNQNIKVEISFCTEALGGENLLYGTRESGAETNFSMFIGTDSLNQRVGNQAIQRPSGFWLNNTDYVVIQDKTGQTVNGTFTAYSGTPSNFTSTYNMLICNIGNYTGALFTGKIYYVKIWDNNVLVRNFQPIQMDVSGEYCLLDKVNNQIYHNAGTGNFSGPSNTQASYIKTLYAQTNGSQYINTLVPASSAGKFEASFQIMSRSSGSWQGIIYAENNGSPYNGIGIRASSSNTFAFDNGQSAVPSATPTTGIDYHIIYNVMDGEGIINGEPFTIPSFTNGVQYNMYLFGTNQANSFTQGFSIRLYYLKIYNKNMEMVRDFVPCADNNNIICLYDRITNNFYYVNTGTMSYGGVDWSYIDEEEAQIVGPVLNNILGITGDISEGSYETEVEPVLDDILGGVI